MTEVGAWVPFTRMRVIGWKTMRVRWAGRARRMVLLLDNSSLRVIILGYQTGTPS